MPLGSKFIKGTCLRVAAPGDMVECIVDHYNRIGKGAVLRVAQTSPSNKTDSNWSYQFEGMLGIFRGCNFRLIEDKFKQEYGGQSKMVCSKDDDKKCWEQPSQTPEIRIYLVKNGRIVERILRDAHETAEECIARADDYIRKNPTAEAHVYRKVALRRTSPAPIENIAL